MRSRSENAPPSVALHVPIERAIATGSRITHRSIRLTPILVDAVARPVFLHDGLEAGRQLLDLVGGQIAQAPFGLGAVQVDEPPEREFVTEIAKREDCMHGDVITLRAEQSFDQMVAKARIQIREVHRFVREHCCTERKGGAAQAPRSQRLS